jgi:RNA polymerase sigma-70 factor (ECF subfamily)
MPKYTTENDLVVACKRGDRLAQRELYERYSRKMFAVCLRYVRQRMEAEDILADSFMKVFTHIQNFKEEGSLEGWVRRIVVNECLGLLRKQRLMYVESNADEHAQVSSPTDHSTQMHADELMDMIQDLPTGYRTIFNLYAIEGYSHKEIAEMLNINENTSKSQLSRARTLLQKKIEGLDKEHLTFNI